MIRDGVGIGILLIVATLVSVLPGAGRELPVGQVVPAANSLAIAAAILAATASVRAAVDAGLGSLPDVVSDLAVAARYAAVFVAVVVASVGLCPVVQLPPGPERALGSHGRRDPGPVTGRFHGRYFGRAV